MSATSSGTRVIRYPEVASTNVEAMRLAQAGEAGPAWIVADVQTAGKGRSGRSWTGTPGNLLASYLFQTTAPVAAAHQLSLVAGVAAWDAVAALGVGRGQGLRLKWPNDLLAGRGKLGGILVESTMLPGGPLTAIIGIGLNLNSRPVIEGREATCLADHGCEAGVNEALEALDAGLRRHLGAWNGGRGFAETRAAWLDRAGPLGEAVAVQGADGPIAGLFAGLDGDGALLIELEGGERHRCTYGDVTLT